jgi:hypothetical protein
MKTIRIQSFGIIVSIIHNKAINLSKVIALSAFVSKRHIFNQKIIRITLIK